MFDKVDRHPIRTSRVIINEIVEILKKDNRNEVPLFHESGDILLVENTIFSISSSKNVTKALESIKHCIQRYKNNLNDFKNMDTEFFSKKTHNEILGLTLNAVKLGKTLEKELESPGQKHVCSKTTHLGLCLRIQHLQHTYSVVL
jgi:hypothetical protein